MKSKETIITSAVIVLIAYTLSLSLVSQTYSAGQISKKLPSTGTIQLQTTDGIYVYSDVQCTENMSALDWGTLEPGENQSIMCHIKNQGITPTTLSLQTTNWNPSNAPDYISLSWDYDEQIVNMNTTITITLTLSISPDITEINTFNFDVIIIGSNYE